MITTAHRRALRAWLDHYAGCARCRLAREKPVKSRWKVGLCAMGEPLWQAVVEAKDP